MRTQFVFSAGNTARFLALAALAALATPSQSKAQALNLCVDTALAGLDPAVHTTAPAQTLGVRQIFDRLVEPAPVGASVRPSLALWWDVSKDGLRYTFKLRHGVKFHTVGPFTPSRDLAPEDVTFSFQRQIFQAHPFYPAQVYNAAEGQSVAPARALADLVAWVEKIGDDKVRFTLRRPDSGFLALLATLPASIQSVEYAQKLVAVGKKWLLDTLPVGTGPFMVAAQRSDDYLKVPPKPRKKKRRTKKTKPAPPPPARQPIAELDLVAHPGHWSGAPNLAAIRILAKASPVARFSGLRAGFCQIVQRPAPVDLPAMRQLPGVSIFEAGGANVLYLAINTANQPFGDPWVRKALAKSIDRQALSQATDQRSTPATGLTRNAGEQQPADLVAARAMLKGAGAEGVKISLLVPTVKPNDPGGIAMAVADAWAEAGAQVTLTPVSWADLPAALAGEDYDAALIGWQLDTPDAALTYQQLLSCAAINAGNHSRWCNAQFDQLLVDARAATDPAQRRSIVAQAGKLVAARLPIIPLLRPATLYATGPGVENVTSASLATYDFTKISLTPDLSQRLAALDLARQEQRAALAKKAARAKAKARKRTRKRAVARKKPADPAKVRKPRRRSNNVFRNKVKKN
ncbi:MAG: ABC transporter substrate-binding protein [Alphaproteobacteria bacterium]